MASCNSYFSKVDGNFINDKDRYTAVQKILLANLQDHHRKLRHISYAFNNTFTLSTLSTTFNNRLFIRMEVGISSYFKEQSYVRTK